MKKCLSILAASAATVLLAVGAFAADYGSDRPDTGSRGESTEQGTTTDKSEGMMEEQKGKVKEQMQEQMESETDRMKEKMRKPGDETMQPKSGDSMEKTE
jgi:hypothetical protein